MSLSLPQRQQPPVHPHARGDDGFRLTRDERETGSPPRAWGRSISQNLFRVSPRFTPTRVGTIAVKLSRRALASVHPHARGDDNASPITSTSFTGSPPRAWGRSGLWPVSLSAVRFTPTRVGTMSPPRYQWRKTSVHPHARGDDTAIAVRVSKPVGSPPRAWGR